MSKDRKKKRIESTLLLDENDAAEVMRWLRIKSLAFGKAYRNALHIKQMCGLPGLDKQITYNKNAKAATEWLIAQIAQSYAGAGSRVKGVGRDRSTD